MHPNLSDTCPLRSQEPSVRLNLTQAALLLITWGGMFAAALTLLP